jgi:3'-5' exoribonuclease
MTEKIFINNYINGMELRDEILFVEEKSLKIGKRGHYLDLLLKDKTGTINSKVWDKVDELNALFAKGDFISIQGIVEKFNEKPQLRVVSLNRVDNNIINPLDFMECIHPDQVEYYFNRILEVVEKINNPYLKKLLYSFFNDPEFVLKFKKCPAAKSLHHAQIGGLVKHVSYMLALANRIASLYKVLNTDLLYTGVIFHDIGKILELEADSVISYTTEGEMIGHSVLGTHMVKERSLQIPGFPVNLMYLLEHIILSHHGLPEYGAVKIPQFREAWILHLIDNIDAKMEIMNSYISKIPNGEMWSEKCWALNETRLLKIDQFHDFTENNSLKPNSEQVE